MGAFVQISKIFAIDEDDNRVEPLAVWFRCPGCKHPHKVGIREGTNVGHVWDFNWDYEKPSFNPSYLSTHPRTKPIPNYVCHLFIRDGKIEFLTDCSHDLAGQTIDIPDWK